MARMMLWLEAFEIVRSGGTVERRGLGLAHRRLLAMAARLTAGQAWKGRLVNRRRNGEFYTAEQTTTPIPDATGRFSHFVSVQEDISERLRAQD